MSRFTVRNVVFNDVQTGSEAIIDVEVRDTPIFIRTSVSSQGQLRGSLVLNNIELNNVKTAVGVASGDVLLQGGKHKIIDTWAQGNIYSTSVYHKFVQAEVASPYKPASLLDKHGRIVSKMHPQYEDINVDRFLSARDHGCKGDGHTDETQALQTLLNKAVNENKLVFIDAGVYVITDTLKVPAGSRVVGEAWSVISGKGKKFQDPNEPRVMVQVGGKGSIGTVEISDIMFSTIGPGETAFQVHWVVLRRSTGSGWRYRDRVEHTRSCGPTCKLRDVGLPHKVTAGTDLDFAHCPKGSADDACMASFLALHLTRHCSAYLEVFTLPSLDYLVLISDGIYPSGTWVWLADHDLDVPGEDQITLFSGRGILSESQGPVWMIGTGAGLYSFFNNYSQACLDTKTCQSQIANIDTGSSVRIYGLSTVGPPSSSASITSVSLIKQTIKMDSKRPLRRAADRTARQDHRVKVEDAVLCSVDGYLRTDTGTQTIDKGFGARKFYTRNLAPSPVLEGSGAS
ncbi:glycoside hydrolase family protein [Salix suchowensis]|nr:glycoside hydrolase family protein [Salix suchowensis]